MSPCALQGTRPARERQVHKKQPQRALTAAPREKRGRVFHLIPLVRQRIPQALKLTGDYERVAREFEIRSLDVLAEAVIHLMRKSA